MWKMVVTGEESVGVVGRLEEQISWMAQANPARGPALSWLFAVPGLILSRK